MSNSLFIPLESNKFYHIYNRGNNGDNLFYQSRNYIYFLKQYDAYLSEYLETYCYCLLPNHFHLLVRVKEDLLPLKTGTKIYTDTDQITSEAFRRFFTSYAKAVTKQEHRKGSLFQKNYKRKEVDSDAYFSKLVHYIHVNPQKHRIFEDFKNYPYSSYGRILIDKPSKLFKNELIDWFGNKEAYIDFHAQTQDYQNIESWLIEDEEDFFEV